MGQVWPKQPHLRSPLAGKNPVSTIRRHPREEHSTFVDLFRDLLAGFKLKQPFPAASIARIVSNPSFSFVTDAERTRIALRQPCVLPSQVTAASRLQPDHFLRRTEVMVMLQCRTFSSTASAHRLSSLRLAKWTIMTFITFAPLARSLRCLRLAAKRFRFARADR